jgi:DNA polymerase (family 10)
VAAHQASRCLGVGRGPDGEPTALGRLAANHGGHRPGGRRQSAPAGGGRRRGSRAHAGEVAIIAPPADGSAVADALREIGLLLEREGDNRFRARAYDRAARAVEALGESLGALVAEGRLTQVPGIGTTLAATIEELVRTGRSATLERLRQGRPSTGRAPAAARAVRARPARPDGAAREAHLDEAMAEAEEILEHLRGHPAAECADLAGPLRRRAETVPRIDVVAAARDAAAVLEHVQRLPRRASTIERTGDRVILQLTSGLTLHATAVAPASYAAALHHLTGSEAHLARLAAVARARGLTLTASGPSRRGRRLAVRSEADLYRHLGLAYVAPELREDAGEVEAAHDGTLPRDLVDVGVIRGMVHCHTTYSDGAHSIAEMARAADLLGMQYMTITDHSPTATYARGLTVDRLKQQWDEIARVQETVRVRLLRGTESDILADGALDYPDAILEQLDVVIASIHHRHRMDAAAMTRRIVTALRHPRFKIWGHALGRYVLRRPPFACHMDEILDALAGARAAIEVNGDPHRLDMEPRWIREARPRGIKFVVSTDAHSVAALGNLRWGVDMARRGWLSPGDVLNTLDVDAFREAVRP